MKENPLQSVRFWAAILTPLVAALMAQAVIHVPFLENIDPNEVATWMAATGVAFIIGRSFRNTST